jgi:rod shape-determining protein MreB
MITFTVSVNFRNTTITARQDGKIIWNSKIGTGGVDWIVAVMIDLRINHNLLIGRLSAENAVLGLVVFPPAPPLTKIIRGRDMITLLPGSVEYTSNQVAACCHISSFLEWLKPIFQQAEKNLDGIERWPQPVPDALKPSLLDAPIILTGEFGALKGLAQALQEAIDLPVVLFDDAGLPPEDKLIPYRADQ